ncbi:MAG: PilT/PilU family type 4a pilus ATPase [Planctomycetales bacterium]|nr:PilT/PilU family type 4a pilus ATPase [Planctomycetales bacterium]NIM07684.1 PilT/PilU family type 4a pilus ATPase [Planctomycetales bacterium]NIN07187.1 PilT/PilU family type 4a pilus ATPase [Planctomycetales bacterium]NIN76280.1 PilT/PilU family type 4a pilus ATPase [Planctomycetales bacterium]NIO33486.1 PilT/PilU family type 4a pilus ATPase [Planctomycetales bacterium]
MPKIDELLLNMSKTGASDLHMVVDQKPKYRVDGEVVIQEQYPVMDRQMVDEYLSEIMTAEQKQRYLEVLDFDFAYGIADKFRYRCNYFFQRTGYGAVFRIIPTEILTLEQLNLPPVLMKLCNLRAGLVLVTGPTGSGKSTTLAAMINHINETQRRHVLTIEDPVEFVHHNKQSMISHREVGNHTKSFGSALRAVTRQDADVVLVGEMRDLETISLALSAAAMGTLVYGTLHTNSAPKTIDRIIDVFPTDQQPQVRTMLAESLRGIVAQQLLRKKSGKGRVAVNEILLGNRAVSSIVREGKIEALTSVLQSGRREGMQEMDDALERLVEDGTIDGRDAYMKAVAKKRFEQYMPEED